jgi:hypothetical protein
VRSPAFQEVVSSFADLLRLLPPPVILILDTCEELSKLEPVASTLPSVEATFAILEQLQVYIPTVRVVFAGRRLLAQSGDSEAGRPARWKADAGALNERNRYLPDHKEYLRLHVIRGFTGRESDQFLEQIADLRLDSDRKTAILERSAEISKPVEIQWAETHSEDRASRYNPFDLALYAEWLRESPAVTASTIRSGQTEPYVEMRIVRRLESEPIIRRALPAAVLLRRFDDEMLRPVAPDDASRAALFRDLQANEWTDAQRDEDLATWFLEVNPNLRSRIESYYAALPQRLELDRMREQLGPALDQRVRASLEHPQWFNQLNFSRVEPALRLQPPEAAAFLWDKIDERVTGAAEWNWAFRICPQLLGEGNVAGKDNAPLQAAIRATLNGALLHLQRDFDPKPTWQAVARASMLHPVPEIADWLKYRADVFAGEPFRVPEFASHYRQQQAYACLLGQTYEGRFPSTWLHLAAIPEALDFGTSELFDYRKELPQDLSCLHDFLADTLKDVPEMPSLVQRWADWRIPDCLTDRMRLELALRAGVDAGKARSWALSALARLDNIDSERLLSALLNRDDVVTIGLMDRATAANYYDPERVPSGAAHRATRPLYAVLAEQCNRQGRPDDAIKVLDRVRSIMLDSRQPADAVRQVDALAAQIREKPQVLPAQPAAAPAKPASSRFALFLIGLAVITVSIYALYELTRWALGKSHILAFLSIVACIPVIWYFVPILLEFMLREISVLLKPSLLLVSTGQRIHASYWRSGRRGPKWLPLPFSIDLRNRQAICEEEFDIPPASAYSDTAVRLAHHMRRLIPPRFPGLKMPVKLEIGREIQGIAWEALINLGLAGPQGRVREHFQFWRGGEPDVSTDRAEWRESQSVVVLCRSRDLPAMERAWAGKIAAPVLYAIDESNILPVNVWRGEPGSFTSSRVMHLVGRTRRSSGERLFQLTPEHYLAPTNFATEFVHIVIVQCQLVESLERTGTDREQSAALREFAAELFIAGAKTVIFLPQMPVVISDKVLTRLVAFCSRRREPSLFALLDTISDIRKIISKSISTTAATRTEAGQKYTHSESVGSPGPSVEGEVVDSESLNTTRGEMSMDVTVWTRLAQKGRNHGRLR